MDDFLETEESRFLTANEVNAVMKNTVEERLFLQREKLIRKEHKRNAILIRNLRFNAENLYDSVKLTTGSSRDRVERIFNTRTNTFSVNLMGMNTNNLHRSKSVTSKRVVKFNYNNTDPELVKRKVKSASEINKSNDLEDDSLEVFVFNDRKLYDNYLELCFERDQVPRSLPQRVEILKKRDPVFAKRYKQFLSAKLCNRAPKFDDKDNIFQVKLPKLTIEREKQKFIKLVQSAPHQKPDYLKIELERINHRVKTFVENFDNQLIS